MRRVVGVAFEDVGYFLGTLSAFELDIEEVFGEVAVLGVDLVEVLAEGDVLMGKGGG